MDALPDFVKLAEAYGHVGLRIEQAGGRGSLPCARPSA
jgi:thiamine pyrophosphate-dependent acetolactate synthase large subunit-like protein